MKLVDVEYTFDRNKVVFYFTADGRVDFRELSERFSCHYSERELNYAKLVSGMKPRCLVALVLVAECFAVPPF